DIDLAAFLQIFAGDLGQSLPKHEVVPFCAVLPGAALVFEPLVCGESDLRNRCALRRVLHFPVFAQISNKNDFVDALCHECGLLRRVTIAERARWKLWYLDMGTVTDDRSEAPAWAQDSEGFRGIIQEPYACRNHGKQSCWNGSRRTKI